jgi:hypothetical protein
VETIITENIKKSDTEFIFRLIAINNKLNLTGLTRLYEDDERLCAEVEQSIEGKIHSMNFEVQT